jgi:hypothetical protein
MSFLSLFSANEWPVFAGPDVDNPGQYGKFIAYTVKPDGLLARILSLTGLYSILKIGGNEMETAFGGFDDKGTQRKLTSYSEEAKTEKPAPPPRPAPPPAPTSTTPETTTMPGCFFDRGPGNFAHPSCNLAYI